MRYLQDCVEKLQSRDPSTPTERDNIAGSFQPAPYNPDGEYNPQTNADEDEEDDDDVQSPDVEMTNSSPIITARPPTSSSSYAAQHQPSISPALPAQDGSHARHYSYSSATTLPGWYVPHAAGTSNAGSTLTSPALGPMREERDLMDHEATAALLMLNSDRRGAGGPVPGRGMSVRDLLSA